MKSPADFYSLELIVATTSFPLSGKSRPGVLYPYAQWYFLLAMVITWVGFGSSYFAVIRTEPLLHHIHGALMGGWIALLILQPVLYQRGRIKLHRTLGRWGAFALVPAIVVVGVLMMRRMLLFAPMPPFIVNHLAFLDFCSLILFPTYVALAIKYGRNVQLHARYIVCTVLLLMPPALARALPILPMFRHGFIRTVNTSMGVMIVVLLVLVLDDLRRGKIRAPYLVGLATTAASALAANYALGWGWWHAVTAGIERL